MRWGKRAPLALVILGAGLFIAVLAVALASRHTRVRTVTVTVTVPPTTTTAPPPATTTTAQTTTAPTTATTTAATPPQQIPMSWNNGGAIVWHAGDIDPTWLGATMRAAGFGWAAVYLGGPGTASRPDPNWLARFRAASGLPVGGWSVLGDDVATDEAAAVQLIRQDSLLFYIADAEATYGYTLGSTASGARYARSKQFVALFRRDEPDLPAAVSSYCRPDQHDLDWSAWANGAFAFLPQAYVSDFGLAAAPAECTNAATKWFPRSHVHPTVSSYAGARGFVQPAVLAALLAQAHTTGFSIYPAEVGMPAENWQAYGAAIAATHIAGTIP